MGEVLPSYVMDAYHSAWDIAVEADIVSFEQDYARMVNCLKELIYLDGTTIKDHLPAELYEAARQILADNSSYAEELDYYLPIMWSNTIETLATYKLGFDANMGIDRMLIQQAYNDGKKVQEIESAEFQYSMMANFSPELQELLLASAVAGYGNPEYNRQLEEMVYAWCTGDADLLAELTAVSFDSFQMTAEEIALLEEYESAMITTRNASMTEYAVNCLKNKQRIFICVGAGHVVGENGIAQTLSRMGYTVEEIRG